MHYIQIGVPTLDHISHVDIVQDIPRLQTMRLQHAQIYQLGMDTYHCYEFLYHYKMMVYFHLRNSNRAHKLSRQTKDSFYH